VSARPTGPRRRSAGITARVAFLLAALVVFATPAAAATRVENGPEGSVLLVDGAPYMVRGMNWGYSPVGTNYRYSLWVQDDAFVESVLRREMALLREMGVNAIRQYDDIPPRWVQWIFENYGIRTMVNPLFGRYGLEVEGRWVSNVDYANPVHRKAIRDATMASVERFKDTPGVLLWLLGNENNYGLHWTSFEIGDLPEGERDLARARPLYSLYGEVVDAIHAVDTQHPVAIANGDVQYLDLVKEEAPNLDVFGTNVYRGMTARDLYQVVKDTLGVPVLYTEFGADAWDAKAGREDSVTQARYMVGQWRDLYEQARGQGGVGNAVGGFVFQWDDGWWKYRQDENLDVHDTHASWGNGGYVEDYVEGQYNMNEEWFGICAKGPPDPSGHYPLYPRPAWYALREVWRIDPYTPGVDRAAIAATFDAVDPAVWLPTYETALSAGEAKRLSRAYVRDLRVDVWTFTGADEREGTPVSFDHTESVTADLAVRPIQDLEAHAAVNVLGNVAGNLMDEITYETRGRALVGEDGETDLSALERVRLYQLGMRWETRLATVTLFHREGHFHWGYQGDAFGIYREAYYGEAIDIYNADAPSGMEITGKGKLDGAALAFGPQLWWGANPAVVGRYRFRTGPLTWTALHQEDIAQQAQVTSSRAIPQPKGRVSTLGVEAGAGGWDLAVAGIVGGTEQIGADFQSVVPAGSGESYGDSGWHVLSDQIRWFDTLGGRVKLSVETGRVHAYALGTWRGLVADGGPDPTLTFTGWSVKDSGSGNVAALLAGVAVDLGNLQVAPNLLVQRPLVGPLPAIASTLDGETGWYTPAVVPRNVVDDPFAVDGNRETVAGELLFVWDPTPGSWFWAWDQARHEDAPLAMALDLVYRHQPTSRDAALAFTDDGTVFTFQGAPPPADVWDATLRWVGAPADRVRLVGSAWLGQGQSTGEDARLVFRGGVDGTAWWGAAALQLVAKWQDWGPYDYHRSFNLTYPFQGIADLSTGLEGLRLPAPGTRLGVRAKLRTFDEFSPDAETLGVEGEEWELGTYLRVRL